MGAALCNIIYYKRRVVGRRRLTLSKRVSIAHVAELQALLLTGGLSWIVPRGQSGINPILGLTSTDRLEADGFDHPDDFIAGVIIIALNYDQLPFSCIESGLPVAQEPSLKIMEG
jgi:hypothetical protein